LTTARHPEYFGLSRNNLRAYSSAVVANALGVDRRWLDSVVIQHDIAGVRRERQGVSRTISPLAVLTIAVGIALIEALHLPIATALELGESLILHDGEHSPVDGMSIRVDVPAIERRVSARLTEAVEAHPPPRRGRPPRAR
jgi:hypothetical protein